MEMSFNRIESEIIELFDSMERRSKRQRLSSEFFLIRIASGGESSPQEIPVARAVNVLITKLLQRGLKVKVESKDPKAVHSSGPQSYVDWLLEADFHIISTHIHQGNYPFEFNFNH